MEDNRKRPRPEDEQVDELDELSADEDVTSALKSVPKKLPKRTPRKTADASKTVPADEDESADVIDVSGESAVDKAKVSALFNLFSEEQRNRYEAYRRSRLKPAAVQEVMKQVAGPRTFNSTSVLVMAGIAKLYVGELIELAREVQDEFSESTAPMRPRHVREAFRRLSMAGKAHGINPAPVLR